MSDLNEARTACKFDWDDAIKRARTVLEEYAPAAIETVVEGAIAANLQDAFELGYMAGSVDAAVAEAQKNTEMERQYGPAQGTA